MVALFTITNNITKYTGYSINQIDESDFEKCLDEQYIALYINTADSTKTIKQIQLQDYLEYPEIINCYTNNDPCIQEKIQEFPTWIINEHRTEGDLSFSDLVKFSGCRFA